jgi:hypothetical protein
MRNPAVWPCAIGLAASLLVGGSAAQSVDRALAEQERLNRNIQQTQTAVDRLDDQTRAMLEEYLRLGEEADGLRDYNAQVRRMTERQDAELGEFQGQLNDVEELRRRLFPLLIQMVDVLDQLVARDAPFLPAERQARVQALKATLDDPALPPAEKFRRIMEAYQIEMEYAHTIEAYQGDLETADGSRTVDFLRFGRVGLYYLSLDGSELGHWNRSEGRWEPLAASYRSELERGIRIARKQLPPDLVPLPVPAPALAAGGTPAPMPAAETPATAAEAQP